ncbi:MAG: hypothetical protein OEL78_01450 [Hyphomicrobiales bacterium]|nr:hypothetical protein [Hyphomicrobiales bacterium]
MTRILTAATAAFFLLAAPALAAHCPKDAAAVEAGLSKSTLSDAEKAEISALKDQGMQLHNAGDHRASEAALADAMRRLLNAQ